MVDSRRSSPVICHSRMLAIEAGARAATDRRAHQVDRGAHRYSQMMDVLHDVNVEENLERCNLQGRRM